MRRVGCLEKFDGARASPLRVPPHSRPQQHATDGAIHVRSDGGKLARLACEGLFPHQAFHSAEGAVGDEAEPGARDHPAVREYVADQPACRGDSSGLARLARVLDRPALVRLLDLAYGGFLRLRRLWRPAR